MTTLSRFFTLLALTGALTACDDGTTEMDAGNPEVDAGDTDAGPLPSTVRPTKRSDFWAVADPASGTIALFGGDDGPIVNQIPQPNFLDETWVFEPGVGWAQVEGATHPSARGRYAAAYDAANERMIVFGGRYRATGTSGNYTVFNDLWAFSFADRTWTQLHDGSGTAPPARYFAGVAVDSAGTIYVAGGATNSDALSITLADDLWSFDGTAWTEQTLTGETPQRLFIAWGYDSMRNRLLAFGGQSGDFVSASLNDLHALDLATGTWSVLDDGFTGTAPEGRFNAMLAYDSGRDRYMLFGGHGDLIMNNQVWAYDPAGAAWSLAAPGDTPTGNGLGCLGNPREIPNNFLNQDLAAPQGRQTGGWAILGGTAYALLGESDCSDHLDDTWSFDLASSTWSEVIEARTGESCDRRGDDCMCLCQ